LRVEVGRKVYKIPISSVFKKSGICKILVLIKKSECPQYYKELMAELQMIEERVERMTKLRRMDWMDRQLTVPPEQKMDCALILLQFRRIVVLVVSLVLLLVVALVFAWEVEVVEGVVPRCCVGSRASSAWFG
jgi:hypothetical protein